MGVKTKGPSNVSIESVLNAVEHLLEIDHLVELVHTYLEGPPATKFAGALFDELQPNETFKIGSSDLVAVSLLDVRFGSSAVQELLFKSAFDAQLAGLPEGTPLWLADDSVISALERAFDSLCLLSGVGRTKATKLLARKRPLLAPITDSLVEGFYNSQGWSHLRPLATALATRPDLVRILESMGVSRGATAPSALRVLDIAIWMTRSNSRSAQTARREILGSPDPIIQSL